MHLREEFPNTVEFPVIYNLISPSLPPPLGHRQAQNYSQVAGSEYFNNMNCSTSRDVSAEGGYASGFCLGRKIDLTGYMRWWGTKSNTEDVARELRALESSVPPTEPYQLPSLGLPDKGMPRALSACSILSRSAAFKNFQERSSEKQDVTFSKEIDRGKGIPPSFIGTGSDHRTREVTLGMDDFRVQRNPYSVAPQVSAPLRTTWAPVDPIPDPVFWTSLVPQTGLSLTQTLTKNEIPSPYTYHCQE